MEIRHLRTFVAVAEQMSFRRAADRLFVSQPTVTAHVAALEAEVGARVFERRPRLALTAVGEALLPYARRLLALHAEAEEHLAAVRAGRHERLRLVASIFVAASTLPHALRVLLAERPQLQLSLRTAFSPQVLQAVTDGDADLGLSRLAPTGRAVDGLRLCVDPVVAVAPAAWGPVALDAALAAHPLFTHNHPGYWDRLLAHLRALGLPVRAMEVRQVDVTRRLMAEGLGLSFLPLSAVAADLRARTLRRVAPVPGLVLPRAGTWALWPRGRPPGGAGQRLVEILAAPGPQAG